MLELGASPFLMTWMMEELLGFEVTPTSSEADYRRNTECEGRITLRPRNAPERARQYRFEKFNLELDPYPYASRAFELVVCCEILEHLVVDPCHMLGEVRRVLRPGGALFLTTPNVVRLENLFRIALGRNVYDPYSGHGVYGRHNREYTAAELERLLTDQGFQGRVSVEDAYEHGLAYRLLTKGPGRARRDNLFALVNAVDGVRTRAPDWLYRSRNRTDSDREDSIVMARPPSGSLGDGWHELDDEVPSMRWTGPEAVVQLRLADVERMVCLRASGGPREARGQVWLNGEYAGGGSLPPGRPTNLQIPLPIGLDRGKGYVEFRIAIENPIAPPSTSDRPTDDDLRGIAVERIWLA